MREGRRAAVVSATLCACLGVACRAQVKTNADVRVALHDDRRWEPEEAPGASLPGAPTPASPRVPAPPADPPAATLVVARDLALAAGAPREPVCRCLALAYGPPDDPRFLWKSSTSTNIPADALAIAITGENVPCAGSPGGRRASVAGVGREGDDVVLTVETVREGTPVMRGAVVPRPPAGAHLVVRGRAGAPYGNAAAQPGPCRIQLR